MSLAIVFIVFSSIVNDRLYRVGIRLWTGSNVTYFEIRESDESILAALEEFQVGSLTLNRSCASHAAKREIDIANSSYPVCVLTGMVGVRPISTKHLPPNG